MGRLTRPCVPPVTNIELVYWEDMAKIGYRESVELKDEIVGKSRRIGRQE
jgi:hypothetical protein